MMKTKNKTKNFLFYKKESERTRGEKLCRNLVFFGLAIFTAVMWFLLINANVHLANAESDYTSNSIVVIQDAE